MKPHIIITGGAQGIGKITTQELLKSNYLISVFDHDKEALDEFESEIENESCSFYQVDVSKEKEVVSAIGRTLKRNETLYGLINNAAISINKPITELTLNEWQQVLNTNLTGAFLCSKYALPYLKKTKGCIINMASTRAFQSESNTEAYSASKGGIFAFTHALAMSAAPDVRVNCISPGWIDVSGVKKRAEAHQINLSEEDHKQHPAGRVGNALDIVSTILFLLDEKNDFITAQNFVIDGGMTRKMIYM
ncbi:MAG: SDR family oxidoreductase [Dysgonamonadaceae bacterium]|nr:SDR family oxidoreductase [Dysgonamonadaceae bacterium]MDD3727076.1 SDR family oxidoreductase [Dysgonamonadaceae bacterium]